MILSPTYDVIVVGARVAGAATAMRLAQNGLRVLVVDRSRHGADTLSTHALMRGGVMQLQQWGLLDRIVEAGTPPVRSSTFRIGSDEIVIPIKPSHGVDALYAPRRTVLDPILVDAAVAAGADVQFGVTVTDVQRTRGRVTGIVGHDDRGEHIGVNAGLVIGADGVRSTIADRVHAPIERAGSGAMAVMYGYWRDLETTGYEWEFRSGASVGLIPTNDGETCVFAAVLPSRVGPGGVELMRDLLREASPALAERVAAGTAPRGVRTFGGRPGFMRRAWGPGWALVGDAGYWKDPLSTHGLTDAMRDAELLSRAILSAPDPGPVQDDALFTYQETRDRLSVPLFDVTDRIATQQWTMDEISGLLLELSIAMRDEVAEIASFDLLSAGAC
jgi:flavin-dependent dehydrogenase